MEKLTYTFQKEKGNLLKFLCEENNNLSFAVLNKLLRKKDIKINGKRTTENAELFFGDKIEVFVAEEMLQKKATDINIVFEDENIIVVNKQKGKEVVSESGYDLLLDVNTYIQNQSQTNTAENLSPAKAYAVHRIDKNTKGLVLFAKNTKTESLLLKAFKDHTIKKFYTCTVVGKFPFKDSTKRAYLKKDSKLAKVKISDTAQKGYDQIITHFMLKKQNKNNTSDLLVEIITGKTHQIRAHLAHLGFPIIGDEKYNPSCSKASIPAFNLTATKIVFSFDPKSYLGYLNGKQIELNTKK